MARRRSKRAIRRRQRDRRRAQRLGYQYRQLVERQEAPPAPPAPLEAVPVRRAIGFYDSFDGAMAEMRRREPSGFSAGLAIGLSVIAVLGAGLVIAYVLFRRKDSEPAQQPVSQPVLQQPGAQVVYTIPMRPEMASSEEKPPPRRDKYLD